MKKIPLPTISHQSVVGLYMVGVLFLYNKNKQTRGLSGPELLICTCLIMISYIVQCWPSWLSDQIALTIMNDASHQVSLLCDYKR